MLISKTNNKVNEKAIHYLIVNPEATLKPATKLNIEKYPSLIQQSGREAFDFFKNEKSVVGKTIGEIKEQAIGSKLGQALKTTVKDEYDSVQNLIASNLFRNDKSVSTFLNVLNKELGEQSLEEVTKKKTIRGVQQVIKTPIQKEIGLKELDDTYTRIVQSDGWKELMSKNAGDIQPGDRQVIDIVSSLKNRLYGMFDAATEGTKDYAIKRAKYRNLKEIETNFNMNNSDDVYAAFAQAVLPGNENKLDLLIDVFPKEIFDKNLATIVNMSNKKFTDYLSLRGYASGGGAGFITETLSGVMKGLGKVAGAGMAKPTKYEIGLGSKVLQGTTKGTAKTLRDLIKSGTKQVILNKEDN
jgi:hypothetical protein